MNNFDNYLLNQISQYLKYDNYIKLKMINKNFKEYNNEILERKYNEIRNFIEENINIKIVNLFGGINKFIDYPILKWNDNFLGGTGYIDSIKEEDVNYPIMYGIDCYGRVYITLKFIENERKKVITFFQRYDDYKDCWTHGTMYFNDVVKFTSPFLSYNQFTNDITIDNINNLLNNKNFIEVFDFTNKLKLKKNVSLTH